VGAAPIQNVGAYGYEAAAAIVALEAIDSGTCEAAQIAAADCAFGYRTSRFKTIDRDRFIITSVIFALSERTVAPAYAELAQALRDRGWQSPTAAHLREVVLTLRRGKSMILDENDPMSRSAGSFFLNPVVSAAEWKTLEARWRAHGTGTGIPHHSLANGERKIPAAWLIEQAGFARGYRDGPVGLSTQHALAIVNYGGATALDVLRLAHAIQGRVDECFAIRLTPEPDFVNLAPT
jgi:UDP-N-acetylmuramate dehydrogenase